MLYILSFQEQFLLIISAVYLWGYAVLFAEIAYEMTGGGKSYLGCYFFYAQIAEFK